jgi:hypothetical protein
MPAQRFSADQKQHRSNNGAVEGFSQISSLSMVPIGGIITYAGAVAPPGYLECDGGEYSRTTYAPLFSVIEDNYGAGDGITTFNVPTNAQARQLMLEGHTHTLVHTHTGVTAGAASTGAASATVTSSAGGGGLGMLIIRTGAV